LRNCSRFGSADHNNVGPSGKLLYTAYPGWCSWIKRSSIRKSFRARARADIHYMFCTTRCLFEFPQAKGVILTVLINVLTLSFRLRARIPLWNIIRYTLVDGVPGLSQSIRHTRLPPLYINNAICINIDGATYANMINGVRFMNIRARFNAQKSVPRVYRDCSSNSTFSFHSCS
jgi:hypothetical protein